MEESPSIARFVLISRKERKALKLWAVDRGKERFPPMEIDSWIRKWS